MKFLTHNLANQTVQFHKPFCKTPAPFKVKVFVWTTAKNSPINMNRLFQAPKLGVRNVFSNAETHSFVLIL